MALRAEAFEDVVMPPDDLGQVRALDGMLHRTNSATLRGASGEEMLLPSEVYEVLLEVVTAMSKGQAISVVPKSQRLTTREAADFLGISRPTLVKLLEAGEIPYEQPSRHRESCSAILWHSSSVGGRPEGHARRDDPHRGRAGSVRLGRFSRRSRRCVESGTLGGRPLG